MKKICYEKMKPKGNKRITRFSASSNSTSKVELLTNFAKPDQITEKNAEKLGS
jgi:hypothetical protein